jgi:hypothetical protein
MNIKENATDKRAANNVLTSFTTIPCHAIISRIPFSRGVGNIVTLPIATTYGIQIRRLGEL